MTSISKIKQLSDLELISLYNSEKNREAIGVLYERYTRLVFLVSMKYFKNVEKSKDAVMQIFEKLFSDLLKHEISNFKSWLHTVTRNHCLIILRSEQSKFKKEESYKKDNISFMESDDFEHLTDKKNKEKQLNLLENAVLDLKPEQKQCIDLFYLQEKSYDEVAKITGFTPKQVKSYIQNGKRNIKLKMTKKYSEK